MSSRCQRPVLSSSGRFKNLRCRTFALSRFRVLTPSTNLYGFAWHVLSRDSVGIFFAISYVFVLLAASLQFLVTQHWIPLPTIYDRRN